MTELLLIGLSKQLAKINNSSLTTTHSVRNLGFIFDEHLTFSDQISTVSKSCYYHIRQLRCIRPYLDTKTASTIATSIVHCKLDYCNSLYYNLPKFHLTRFQQIQNSLARAPKSSHITLILRSLHWLKTTERIEYKLLSLTYKFSQPPNLHICITSSQHSLFNFGHSRSSICNIFATYNGGFFSLYAFPRLWNQLPASLRQPRTNLSNSYSPNHLSGTSSIRSIDSPLSSFITLSLQAWHFPFRQIHFTVAFLFFFRTDSTNSLDTLPIYFWAYPFLLVNFSVFHFLVFGSVR